MDALGNPLRWRLTGGEAADIKKADALIEGLSAQAVIADKAYDADALLKRIATAGPRGGDSTPVAPQRAKKLC